MYRIEFYYKVAFHPRSRQIGRKKIPPRGRRNPNGYFISRRYILYVYLFYKDINVCVPRIYPHVTTESWPETQKRRIYHFIAYEMMWRPTATSFSLSPRKNTGDR